MDTTTIKGLLNRHFELGYSRQLLWLDCFFIFAIATDIFFFTAGKGLDVAANAIWRLHSADLQQNAAILLPFLLFVLVLAPLLLAFGRVISVIPISLSQSRYFSPKQVLGIHVFVSIFLFYFFFVSQNMQTFSGWELGSGGKYHLTFYSYFGALVASQAFHLVFGIASWAVAALASAALSFVVLGKSATSGVVNGYLVRASLADLPTQYKPIANAGRFDGPNPSTLVRIEFVNNFAGRILKQYQRLGPSSEQGIAFLDRCFAECNGTITDKLFRAPSPGVTTQPVNISLFTGTRRAMQAALTEMPGPRAIITTPFATPSLLSLLRWHCAITGDQMVEGNLDTGELSEPWDKQEAKILSCLSQIPANKNVIFIISEVFYGTGMRLPLRDFIRRLKRVRAENVHIVVDGTNAVGNRRIVALEPEWSSYIFSPHRWLMATESCGVLLQRGGGTENLPDPPGVWKVGSRKGSTQVRILAGLRGSVELIRTRGLEYFFFRCEQLRTHFKLNLPRGVQIVGDASNVEDTYIFSCCPSGHRKWKFETAELANQISARRLNCTVLSLDPAIPWIRLTIPYYMDLREINRVVDFLDEVS
jgi:selenocysteine lyase/cysteine desulfurase